MQKKSKNSFVYMDILKSEIGFSLVSCLFSLTILFTTLPLIPLIFNTMENDSNYDEFASRQFFHFLAEEFQGSVSFTTNNTKIALDKPNGTTINIDLYDSVIRRRVNNQGYEILLRNVKTVAIKTIEYGIEMKITSLGGESYEKTITMF